MQQFEFSMMYLFHKLFFVQATLANMIHAFHAHLKMIHFNTLM